MDLRWDLTAQPDRSWGVKHYTACFGGGSSSGQWHNLESGEHFFQIYKVDGSDHEGRVTVDTVTVDTSAADGN